MSSLRLALKQSLEESGLSSSAPSKRSEKKERRRNSNPSSASNGSSSPVHPSSSSANRQQPSHSGDAPRRKRGRPPKKPPIITVDSNAAASSDAKEGLAAPGEHRHHHHNRGRHLHADDDEFSSENEFSVDESESHSEDEVDADGDHDRSNTHSSGGGNNQPHSRNSTKGQSKEHQHDNEKAEDHLEGEKHSNRREDEASRRSDEAITAAASKIQSQWKRKKEPPEEECAPDTAEEEPSKQHKPQQQPPQQNELKSNAEDHELSRRASSPTEQAVASGVAQQSPKTSGKKLVKPMRELNEMRSKEPEKNIVNEDGEEIEGPSKKSKTVPPPAPEVLDWARSLPIKRSRKNITPGLRVKVRFATKVKKDGKIIKKKKWFGGRVSAVSKEGSKVRIKYDDGTMEVTKFPDKDVVVDDTDNGKHSGNADKFLPPQPLEAIKSSASNLDVKIEANQSSIVLSSSLGVSEAAEDRSASQQSTSIVVQDNAKISEQEDRSEKEQLKRPDPVDDCPTNLQAPSDDAAETTVSQQSESTPSGGGMDQCLKPKRKRGRPPKHRNLHLDEQSPAPPALKESSDGDDVNSDPTKRMAKKHEEEAKSKHVISSVPNSANETEEISKKQDESSNKASLTIRIPNLKTEAALKSVSEAEQLEKAKKTKKRQHEERASGPIIKRLHIHINAATASSDISEQSGDPDHLKEAVSDVQKSSKSNPTRSPSSPPMKKKRKKVADAQSSAIFVPDLLDPSSVAKPIPQRSVEGGKPVSNPTGSLVSSNNSAFDKNETNHVEVGGEDERDTDGRPLTPKNRSKVDNAPLVRSGRRAAQQANERIATKTDVPPDQIGRKKRKKEKRGDGEGDESESDDDSQWVQCDKCGKWRIIPSSVVPTLPKQWYCANNIWDPKRASCDAAEQTARQVAKVKKRKKRRLLLQNAAAVGETSEGIEVQSTPVIEPPVEAPRPSSRQEELIDSMKAKRASPVVHSPNSDTGNASDTMPKAEKKPALAGKKSKHGSVDGLVSLEDVTEQKVSRPRGRPRRNNVPSKESLPTSSEPSYPKDQDEADNLEWVQCEKCDKWRKLPPHISADELPDVWYCSMNTWNPDSASCDAPEDKADGLQDIGVFGGAGIYAGKLSYRSLIFGNTGRKANRPVSERTRAAESIFATPSDDTDIPPTVMYANSSAFICRSKAQQQEENSNISVLELMSHSHLWSDLRKAARPVEVTNDITASSFTKPKKICSFDALPDDLQEFMKDLLLQSLGTQTLTSDEIINETQQRDWTNVPKGWAAVKSYCTTNIVVVALCELVKEGVLECVQKVSPDFTMKDWNPCYRRAMGLSNGTSGISLPTPKNTFHGMPNELIK